MGFELKTKAKTEDNSGSPNKPATGTAPTGFLKSGADAKKAMEKADAEREAAKNSGARTFRFYMKEGEDCQITFLDGAIDPNTGILDIPYANEHTCKINGRWENFVCIEDQEPCPACQSDNKRAFVGYLTVIDHRSYKAGNGKTYENQRKLFVAKSDTLKQLTKLAEKLPNGLAGTTFDVSRTGDKKPSVGDMFMVSVTHDMKDVVEAFGDQGTALDYSQEAPYLSAEQMNDLGIGKKVATIGTKSLGAKADDIDEGKTPW